VNNLKRAVDPSEENARRGKLHAPTATLLPLLASLLGQADLVGVAGTAGLLLNQLTALAELLWL
jgi:hypothetical protein